MVIQARLILLMLLLVPLKALNAERLMVQNTMSPVKSSDQLEVSQRFECLDNVRLEVYGCPIYFSAGTVGVRISESEFFIARGSIRIGALPPESHFGPRRSPLTFRFFRGQLLATGLETLNLNHGDEVRWLKEIATGLSKIEVDGVSCRAEEQTLFVASNKNMLVLDKGERSEISMEDVENSSLDELILRYHRRRDAQASLATRSQNELDWMGISPFEFEKNRAIARGRRYGVRP